MKFIREASIYYYNIDPSQGYVKEQEYIIHLMINQPLQKQVNLNSLKILV